MSTLRHSLRGRLRFHELELRGDPSRLVERWVGREDAVLLESAAHHAAYGRYTALTCRPLEVLSLRDGVLSDRSGRVLADHDDEALWRRLGDALALPAWPREGPAVPYCPGWFGYLGYELGRHVERLPGRAERDTAFPDLRLTFHDAVLIHDAQDGHWRLAVLELDDPPPGAGQAACELRALAEAASGTPEAPAEPPVAPAGAPLAAWPSAQGATPSAAGAVRYESNFSPEAYRRAVARCVEYIAAGDIFQVNLSQRLAVRDAPPPAAIYRALRRRNPAEYAAYLSFRHAGRRLAVACSSPELFLRVRGGQVITRPIKGTRPRTGDSETDRAAAADLWASPKDNAELAMIIDLLRNDLGRACRYGSVRVTEPRRLETHPTVFHLVGTVAGRLREGLGPADLIRATFPGGSITGAPKIRAMEIIDEQERPARGVYTGCVGWVGAGGDAEWNIVIRTILCDGPTAYVPVGGGIVADSDPQGEYQETLDKARASLEALALARGLRAPA